MLYVIVLQNKAHVKCKEKNGTSNNRGKLSHLKIIKKIPEQHTWKTYKLTI